MFKHLSLSFLLINFNLIQLQAQGDTLIEYFTYDSDELVNKSGLMNHL